MTRIGPEALADALAEVIAAVPGVQVLHPPRPAPGVALELLTGRRVVVTEHDGAADVEVSVGIDVDDSAREIAAEVHRLLVAGVAAAGLTPGDIVVRVASVA